MRSNAAELSRAVGRRDKGVCACCGIDTQAIRWELRKIWQIPVVRGMPYFREQWGPWRSAMAARRLWEADHIVAVSNGGGVCGLDNMQTLCVPCHKKKTSREALRNELSGKYVWWMDGVHALMVHMARQGMAE